MSAVEEAAEDAAGLLPVRDRCKCETVPIFGEVDPGHSGIHTCDGHCAKNERRRQWRVVWGRGELGSSSSGPTSREAAEKLATRYSEYGYKNPHIQSRIVTEWADEA